MIGTITLNPSIDQHILVKHLVKDDANRALWVGRYPGGKGINVSKVLVELGGRTHAYALVGGFSGEFLQKLVEPLNIPLTTLSINGETRINTIVTDVADQTQTRISAPGPRVAQKELDRFLKKLLSVRPKPRFWALGGSLSAGMPSRTYEKFIRALQRNGTPCILDTDNEALKFGIRAKPFLVKPNEYEMQRLCGRNLKTKRDYLKAAEFLVKTGIRIVIVSLGAKGALFVTTKESFQVFTPQVAVKSKVGAGDSLIGGFVLGLCRGMSLRKAACLGVAASTSAVMREAPRLCFRQDISPLLKRVKVR